MAKVLFIQPAYAPYRHDLFDLLHANHDVTYVFVRSSGTSEYHYPGGQEPNPKWSCITLDGEKRKLWPLRLLLLIVSRKPDIVITSINGSVQTIIAIIANYLCRVPVVLWSESWGSPYRAEGVPFWKRRIREMRTRWTTRRAGAVVAGGSRSREYHKALGIPDAKISMSYQSTRDHRSLMSSHPPNTYPSQDPHNVTILYFSRVVESKGLDILLRAYADIEKRDAKVRLIVAGDGPFRPSCEQLANELQIRNVQFCGPVRNEYAWVYFQHADIFVLPCSGKGRGEAWGLVLNEAASMRLPIVTTHAVGAVGDIVVDGINGYVVTPGDVCEMTNALRKLISDQDQREHMGMESRRLFDSINGYQKMYEGFASAIDSVLIKMHDGK